MIDEFVIAKMVCTGSEQNNTVTYSLDLDRHDLRVEDMSLDELKRLSVFLNKYIAFEKGGIHE